MSISVDLDLEWVIKPLCYTWSGGISEALQMKIFCSLLFGLCNSHSRESLREICRTVGNPNAPTDCRQTFARMAII